MTRKTMVSSSVAGALIVMTAFVVYQFLWGKLFPFSPVSPGFARHVLPNAVVYVQKGAVFDRFIEVDSCVPPVEQFHELKFREKPRIFIFRDDLSYTQRSVSKARFCAFSGNSLVVSPWALKEAEEGKISLTIYIRHELSHLLLFQYKGLLAEFRYPNWLLEGIAMYSSSQMGTSWYPGKEETIRHIGRGVFLHPKRFHTREEDRTPLDVENRIAFIYSEFGCIVDYLIETYGRDRFLVYMKSLFGSAGHDRVFRKVYGISFDEMLDNFKRSCVLSGPGGLPMESVH